jgi:hypothetical protein
MHVTQVAKTATTPTPHKIGSLLASTYFAERVEADRRKGFAAYTPWPQPRPTALESNSGQNATDGHSGTDLYDPAGEALWRLLHLGEQPRRPLDPELWAELCALELAREPDENGELRDSGKWELTAYRGLIAARDRAHGASTGEVYIGEDSLRFAETILGLAPRGRALDVGCGSGVSTCALARTSKGVHAIDVVPECLQATRLSMELSGLDAPITTHAGLDDFEAPHTFDCVVGNLPGVPVPPGLHYPPGGAGGPDGLALMRIFLTKCQTWLSKDGQGLAIMRFQSLGDERGPLFLPELNEIADRAGWDISVRTESRIPADVRASLTAYHACKTNPDADIRALLARADSHYAELGYREYYASTLVARPGAGGLSYTNLSHPSLLDRELQIARAGGGKIVERSGQIASLYYGCAHDLPDSFWEMGSLDMVEEPILRVSSILDCLASTATVQDVVGQVFDDYVSRDPVRSRYLLVTVELLMNCLLESGLVVPRPG